MSTELGEIAELRRRLADAERMLEALRSNEGEQRFAAIFHGSTEAMALIDGAGCCVEVNRAAGALAGSSRDELIGASVGAFMANPEALAEMMLALDTGGQLDGEDEAILADGRTRAIEYHAVGNILPGLHLAIYRDVTDTRSAQAARARLAAIVESSSDAIIGLDADGMIEDWNRAAEELYGYRADEVRGRSPAFLEPPSRQGELERFRQRVLGGEEVSSVETVRRRKDGRAVNVSATWSPIRDSTGRVVRLAVVARDVTEQKRARDRFRALLELAPDAMIAVDRNHQIILANRHAARVFGYPEDGLIGESVQLLVPEGLRGRHLRYLDGYAREGRPGRHAGRELRARRKDGSEFDVEITLSPFDHDAEEMVAIAAVRDVTERNKLRDQLVFSDRMASIGTLAAGVAHEINNPLAAIVANVDLALREVVELPIPRDQTGDLADGLEDAREAAARVRQIVRDLKIFSRSTEERVHPVDVERALDTTLRIAWNEIRHRAHLVKDYGNVPRAEANEARLGQVFLNVLVNAAQAIPEGLVERNEIRVTTAVDADGLILVSIRDTGAGMSPEVLKRLFTPFFTTKPVGVGTGLGLSISHRLVTGFGGRIAVDSELGEGTTCRIWLRPAVFEAEEAEPVAETVRAGRRGRILVVDDEPLICHAVSRTLARDHDTTAVTDPREALRRLTSGEHFDVILCDLMMPQMTGMDLHAELVKLDPGVAGRMVFLTGGAFTARARDFLDNVHNQRLEKPFDPAQLRALINDKID